MSIIYLKKGIDETQRINDDDKVKKIVETTLKQIKNEGDKFIRELSQKFDNYSPDNFKLSEEEIIEIVNQVPADVLDDIKFAQEQIRNFAKAQMETLSDLEVETMPELF